MIPPGWTGGELCMRLSLSLGHFLWQGTAIALLASLALACLRPASSRVRYGVSVIAMGLMALCLPLTFMSVRVPPVSNVAEQDVGGAAELFVAASEAPVPDATMSIAATDPRPATAKAGGQTEGPGPQAFSQFCKWAGAIWPHVSAYAVMCYLLGVLAMLGRLAFGLRGGSRLRQLSKPVHEPQLLEMLARQAKTLRLSFTPAVAYCEKVVVPTVVGVVRPAILLPVSVLTGLRSDQVEALLAHELAHIRRFDHLVNLAQRVVEAVLFFHPAVWIISRRIRIEREICCDDMVVASGGEAVAYAASLVRMAELSRRAGRTGRLIESAALMATRGPSGLHRRVVRLLGAPPHEQLRVRRGWTFALGLVVVGALLIAAYVNTGAAQSAATERSKSDGNAVRILHFPQDRSLGALYVWTGESPGLNAPDKFENYNWPDWDYFGEAQGDVPTPAGKRIGLAMTAGGRADLSPLERLAPAELFRLDINVYGPGEPSEVDDKSVQHLRGLTGLEDLNLLGSQITEKGAAALTELKSLKHLALTSDRMGNDGLGQIGKLQSLESLQLAGPRITDAGMTHLAGLSSLSDLWLLTPNVRGPGFAELAKLPSLRCLSLRDCKTGNVGMQYVAKISGLKTLNLMRCPVTDAGIAFLAQMPGLEELGLYGTRISNGCLAYLREMRSLKNVDFGGGAGETSITDGGLKQLDGMKTIEAIGLPYRAATDLALSHAATLPNLKKLRVSGSSEAKISDQGLLALQQRETLESIDLPGPRITDEGLAHIATFPLLKQLNVDGHYITDAGVAQLARLKNLASLGFGGGWRVTTVGLTQLSGLEKLRQLTADGFTASGPPLNLARLTQLSNLQLTGCQLRDEDLACLENLRGLKSLCLSGTFGDAGVAHLENLTGLMSLRLSGTFGDAGVAHLARLTSLHWLDLLSSGQKFTDHGLESVSGLQALSVLRVSGNFSDQGLRLLEPLKALNNLWIRSESSFSPATIQHLQSQLPNLWSPPQFQKSQHSSSTSLGRGDTAPPFKLTTLDGKPLSSEGCRGKVVLLYFWATWAQQYAPSAAELKKAYEELSCSPDFVMIGVSLDDDEAAVREFVQRQGFQWAQARAGRRADIARDYLNGILRSRPWYCLIGRDGKVWAAGPNTPYLLLDDVVFTAEVALKEKPPAAAAEPGTP